MIRRAVVAFVLAIAVGACAGVAARTITDPPAPEKYVVDFFDGSEDGQLWVCGKDPRDPTAAKLMCLDYGAFEEMRKGPDDSVYRGPSFDL